MSEAVEQITTRRLPLDETHALFGASMAERDGWMVPADYGDVGGEYESVRGGGAGVIDLSARGLIEVGGAEAVQFLNGLVTNDVKTLADGAWMPAAFPNVQGRLLAHARVVRRGDLFLFDTEPSTRERVLQTLERFTLAGDFRVADRSGETALLSVQGAGAAAVIDSALGAGAARVERGRVMSASWRDGPVTVIRATHTAEDGFDLFVEAAGASALWDALARAGARPVGFDALEVLRVEAGVPRYGVDMAETNVVLEAGLDDAVSFTKGCYVGQEIIARIHWRGHVAKKLAGLIFDDAGGASRESRIRTPDGKEIGRVTSSVLSPRLGRAAALAYVKYDYLKPGTEVRVVEDDAERAARVAELPLVRGSWFDGRAGTEGPVAE
ncbi:MAG: aminomethyltransferase family protein [Pyrinomonadaceae bacterium]